MRREINYDQELNPRQLEAVRSTVGPHLVIAGAGSGKTRVLVYRVVYLVEQGVSPEEILLLTFTRRAANEMLRRATALLDERCSRVAGGTFHSFANMILRLYAPRQGLSRSFSILDQSDAEDTLNLIRTNLGCAKQEKRFPRKNTLLDVISKSVNKSADIASVVYDEYPQFMEWTDDIAKIANEYRQYKFQKSLLDYDDLLVFLRKLLENHEDIRKTLSEKYKYIMVDEYQDTNKLQAQIACLLASQHANIMAVGDDAQSIYSFRGADFKNIMDFPRLFKNAKIITLEENYRSSQPILDLTNQVIAQAREKFDKKLFTRKSKGKTPVFVDAADENAQSRFVADTILKLREEGVDLGEIAVLFRSGWHSNDLEIELASRNIPFVKYGGQKFVEAAHIKDVLSFLRIVYNPVDEVSWHRLLLLLPHIGPKTAEKILVQLRASSDKARAFSQFKMEPLNALANLLSGIDSSKHMPDAIVQAVLKYYQPLLQDKYDDFNKRVQDLDSLIRIASRYKSLETFLGDMALEPPERSIVEAGNKDRADNTMTLSTIHSAKGLEWHTVFILYVAEGHLPSYLSLESPEAIEEERRLFYVASTRAKENLFLLKPHIDRSPRSFYDGGGRVFTQVSRFLAENDLLNSHTEIIGSQNHRNDWDTLDESDFIDEDKLRDEKFLRIMKEHFRDMDTL